VIFTAVFVRSFPTINKRIGLQPTVVASSDYTPRVARVHLDAFVNFLGALARCLTSGLWPKSNVSASMDVFCITVIVIGFFSFSVPCGRLS